MPIEKSLLLPDLWHFLLVWAITQGRLYVFFSFFPAFSGTNLPFTVRTIVSMTFGLILIPYLMPTVPSHLDGGIVFSLILKEALVGLSLSFMSAIPFWIFEAMGFFVDNQRGAGIGGLMDPLTGNESAPFGQFMHQFFIATFFYVGGINVVLGMVYQSYTIWAVMEPMHHLNLWSAHVFGLELNRLMYQGLLYGSPILLAMFLVELGLALISRFVPQIQVFILAMPLKTAAGFFVAIPYMVFLEPHILGEVSRMGYILHKVSLAFS
ncbi:type III secretion system export apparatus subunit SctT [Candidatus Ichthyocystis hellenicum]|uniref:type III secretion system export apparatus subunit SctT n=1 Tax=Candidatus Ichthyocystis hellenicum TaxID=1561003 RepID=UPI000B84AB06|nr:type III secretion system export apparatus subunit SctT [Candidatus Ichthyocystis hellenicum]